VQYFNDGDWVESCSALVEHWDGTLELLDWACGRSIDAELHRAAHYTDAADRAAVAA
jgi:hypothetical protein